MGGDPAWVRADHERYWDSQAISVQGVQIPFANVPLLLRLKQTYREKDVVDRLFLQDLLKNISSIR